MNHEKVAMYSTFITVFFNYRKWGVAKYRLNGYELPESFSRTLALIHLLYPLVNYRHRDNLLTTDFIFRKYSIDRDFIWAVVCYQRCGNRRRGVPAESWGSVQGVSQRGWCCRSRGEEEWSGKRAV